ncbi:juvenile hormone esterase-like isoform X2 [Periplaneta americana]|uniref:juvenile hormone esterase-like isoform X2 n=1 Tax=Periplaneta americana TaxID=6978 RepID=UPI0037E96E86
MPIMKCFTFSAAIFPLFFSLSSSSEADLIVLTSHGPVRGTILISSRSNRPFFAFMGIPYAKPPVGDLRFKPLQPAESWTEVKNATVEGSMCPQVSEWTNAAEGEEDCLFINVFTPKLPSGPNATLLAVMAVIHGGGFTIGSGNRNALGPDFLVDEDVVIVTFNYRLGLLGFLSLQNSEVPGNNGLKDETFALRWVKQNIDRFGGDPSKVTVAGNSAGAAAVHFQVLSPMSRGLFQRAIEESGSALNPWAFQSASKSVDMAFRVGKFLGTNTTDKNELLRYLKSLPMEQLWRVVTSRDFKFLPTTEINITNDEVFLPDMPINMINAGNFNKVYYLIGVTSREGIIIVQSASHADELGYLYRSTFTNKTFVPGSPELEMSKRIVRLWANFVKTGNPTPEADPLLQNVAWKPLTKTEFPYLDIDTNLTLQHDLLKKAMNFWDQLARNYTTHTC